MKPFSRRSLGLSALVACGALASACGSTSPLEEEESAPIASANTSTASWIAQQVMSKAIGFGVSQALGELVGVDSAADLSVQALKDIGNVLDTKLDEQALQDAINTGKGYVESAAFYVRDTVNPRDSYTQVASALDPISSNLVDLSDYGIGGAQMYQLVSAVRATYLMEEYNLAREYLDEGQAADDYVRQHRSNRCAPALTDVSRLVSFYEELDTLVDDMFPDIYLWVDIEHGRAYRRGKVPIPVVDPDTLEIKKFVWASTTLQQECVNPECNMWTNKEVSKQDLKDEANGLRREQYWWYIDTYAEDAFLGTGFSHNMIASAQLAATTCSALDSDDSLVLKPGDDETESVTVTLPDAPANCGAIGVGEGLTFGQRHASCNGLYYASLDYDGTLSVWSKNYGDHSYLMWQEGPDEDALDGTLAYTVSLNTAGKLEWRDVYDEIIWTSSDSGSTFAIGGDGSAGLK